MLGTQLVRLLHTSRSCWSSAEKSLLSQLRKSTGYTFSNCKKALEMHGNDVAKAEEWLKQQAQSLGWSKATKLEGRVTAQGLVGVSVQNNHAALVEVNCETDFVARNEKFQTMVGAACNACLQFATDSIRPAGPLTKIGLDSDSLRSLLHNGKSLADHLALMIGSVGENASLRRAFCFKAEPGIHLAGYTHPAQINSSEVMLGKYGAILAYKHIGEQTNEHIGKQLCQHIVGMTPIRIGVEGKDEPNKNADNETCLIFQEYLLDPNVTVNEVLLENHIHVVDFKRFECGENLETKETQPLESVTASQ